MFDSILGPAQPLPTQAEILATPEPTDLDALSEPELALLDTGPSPNGWHGHENELFCDQYAALQDAGHHGDRDPLVRGTLIHIGLAHIYVGKALHDLGQDPWKTYLTPEDAVWAKVDMEASPLYAKWAPTVVDILRAYKNHWSRTDRDYTVESVERVYTWPAGTLIKDDAVAVRLPPADTAALIARGAPPEYAQFRAVHIPARDFTARIDLVLRHRINNLVYVMDHKGCGVALRTVPQRYVLSGQFLGLKATGAAVWGAAFGGVFPNLIGTRTPYQFARPPLEPAPHAFDSWPQSVREAHRRRELRKIEAKPLFAHTKVLSERLCIGAYGRCDMFDHCRLGPPENTLISR